MSSTNPLNKKMAGDLYRSYITILELDIESDLEELKDRRNWFARIGIRRNIERKKRQIGYYQYELDKCVKEGRCI